MPHHTLFISDLHLTPEQPEITGLFLDFLKNQAPAADALYILGDLFEVWIGDDHQIAYHLMIQNSIKQLAQTGKPIYFMHGNRDFLIGKTFAAATGCQLLKDPTVIDLYGQRVLLTHGDFLCTADKKHQKFRYWTNNTIARKLFLLLPLIIRQHIANKIRRTSMQRGYVLATDIMDVVQIEVEKIMHIHNVNYLIHGHTHKANIHDFLLHNQLAKRIVLGDWHKQGSALQWQADNSFKLMTINKINPN